MTRIGLALSALCLLVGCTSGTTPSAVAATYSSVVVADHPVAYWRLNDTNATAVDAMGHINGTIVGSPTKQTASLVATDTTNRSIKFDGTNDRITVNGLYNVGAPWAGLTLEAWVEVTRTVPSSEEHITNFSTSSGSHAPGMFHDSPTNKIKFSVGSATTYALANSPTSSGIYYVAATVGTDNVSKLYVNGALQSQTGTMTARPKSGYLFQIGADYDLGPVATSFWKGRLDEVAVYNKGLTTTQVQAHYNAGK